MNEDKESKKIARIKESILRSGYPLEIEIGTILREKGWLVGNQWPYVDLTTKKTRAIDVLAMKFSVQSTVLGTFQPEPPAFLSIMECKRSSKNDWVFYTQQKEKEFLPAIGTIVDFASKVGTTLLAQRLGNMTNEEFMRSGLSGLHIVDTSIKIGIVNASNKSGKQSFYEASKQILSALASLNQSMKAFSIFPVIIFDGEIYEFFPEKGETCVLPANHIQFMTFKDDNVPCLIDVIRRTYFRDFLTLLEKDFTILANLLGSRGARP